MSLRKNKVPDYYFPGANFLLFFNVQTRRKIIDKVYRSHHGNVVIRVAPGGNQYDVFVLNDTDT
jgi:hypothetical protein